MVKVRRERPSQRLHHRVTAPIKIGLEGGTYDAQDWSLGGFRVACGNSSLKVGDVLSVDVFIPFQGFEIRFEAQAEVRRVFDDAGTISCAFKEFGEREREIMEHFVNELVRGSVSTVDDTLLRIDTPVTPVSTKPDANPLEETPVRRWPIKQIILSSLYFVAGLIVIAYGATIFSANFLRMEITSALVTAPIETLVSTVDGKIEQILIEEGDFQPINTALFTIEDAKIEERIEMAKIQIERATMELVAQQKKLEAERSQSPQFRSKLVTKLEKANAGVRSLTRQAELIKTRVDRLEKLLAQGLATRTAVEKAKKEMAIVQGDLDTAIATKIEAQAMVEQAGQSTGDDGNQGGGRVGELQTEVDLGWDKIMLAKDELMALERHKDRLTLSAPSNGRVIKVFKGSGASVKSGEEVGLFERDERRKIQAYLTQEEVLEVGLSDEATVYFPALDTSVRATVININRTGGYVSIREASYKWVDQKKRNALVVLEIKGIPEEIVRERFLPGMPAIVNFKRRGKSGIIRSNPLNYQEKPAIEEPKGRFGV